MSPTDLKQLMAATQTTPQVLAHMLGCTDTTVYNWLGGRIKIRKIQAIAITAVLEGYKRVE